MCGIAGVLGLDVDADALRDSCAAMRHRGPDGDAIWQDRDIGLAHTRLAIIDRAGGTQPMFSADDRYVVVFNGEIYNHRELRRELERSGGRFRTNSDTEVLLGLYARDGAEMVERLRGMFSFVVVDRLERTALLARDRFGKKPLCFAELGDGLAFASTLDALRPLLPSTPAVNLEAIAHYLVLQYVPAPLSAWTGVQKLPPGHVAQWRKGRLEVRRYWSPPERVANAEIDRDEAAEHLRQLVHEAVTVRLESEVPLGVFLSGGLDSSVVVAELATNGTAPATFSVGFKRKEFDETSYARMVADRFGTQHHELVADDDPVTLFEELTRAYDEPFADSSALATLAVAKAASEHVTVVLTGDGGDELFGGYTRYASYRQAERMHRRLGPLAWPASIAAAAAGKSFRIPRLSSGSRWVRDPWSGYRNALFHFPPAQVRALLRPEALDGIDPTAPEQALDGLWENAPQRVSTLSWIDQSTYLPHDLLVKMDRATMSSSLEARSPLLDHELAAYAATLPESLLFDDGEGKALVRYAYRKVLPTEVLTRPKMGFGVPLGSWLRTELRPLVQELLLSDGSPLGQWIRPERIRPMVAAVLRGSDDDRWKVWNLLALAGWAQARSV
ncbi:MAG: asparagine synthase (glutamine-hydrolyzing) [Actinomycetota bacterium]